MAQTTSNGSIPSDEDLIQGRASITPLRHDPENTSYLAKLRGIRLTELGADLDVFPDRQSALVAVHDLKRQIQDRIMLERVGIYPITPDQSLAARAFLKVNREQVAKAAGINLMTLCLFELRKNLTIEAETMTRLVAYFEAEGVRFRETETHWAIEVEKRLR